MNVKLAAELADILPTIKESWTFSSKPGWYLSTSDEADAWPMFWDGQGWHDPVGDIEQHITELLIPHLEDMFKQGFIAGFTTAQGDSSE
ncbi:hypothetical protein SEA_DANFORTH_88 [Mycobacterium phage Danforth]|uniref:Uncharacterized protein n=1 Tax=Mycobacterium phage Saintus TaxID=2923007 RepID=G8IRG6_9CAUD|nr:hypothetical protein FGG39_gp19 [Mycobacterium phage Saintus]AER26466.1 hypothetical protein SAINTUS_83 [Mycobacterium phage Saintus]QJD50191.1 hypothetical protein SEA_DANFORTH_88 [Mycobacterium phage Danforth]